MSKVVLPEWAESMREIYRAETINQFIITGNIKDFVMCREDDKTSFQSLRDFLADKMFQSFDIVIFYDKGRGIQITKGWEFFYSYLSMFDKFHGTKFSSDYASEDAEKTLKSPGLLPRGPELALELLDRFIMSIPVVSKKSNEGKRLSAAIIIDYAHFIFPRGESLYMSGEIGTNLIKVLNWAENPTIAEEKIATVLLAENLNDLSLSLVENPYSSKIKIDFPNARDIEEYLNCILKEDKNEFKKLSEVDIVALASKLTGLNRVNIKNLVMRALRNNEPITMKYLSKLKKETIEKEASDRLEFMESKRSLDDVAGHEQAKKWLREDAVLLKKGALRALPMGYLITGRIGTGKTYLVQCFAGECGIPFVELKNFREKWVGATEGNLEKIFTILHALGQVVVFVDEADQATGKRGGSEGDSGLSGRVYGMLAKEMANTDNRGKIIWIFATSRPDMLEVDLKRQGRLDVHIPLFPPVDEKEKKELLIAMAKKYKIELAIDDVPDFGFAEPVSGNELEGLIVRVIREFEIQDEQSRPSFKEVLKNALADFRPSAHTARLELMDLLAVKECTDTRFLPERFRNLSPTEIDKKIRTYI